MVAVEGKVAVVLGGGADIGAHIIRRLIGSGRQVVATFHSDESRRRLRDLGVKQTIEMDAGDPDSVARLGASFRDLDVTWDSFFSSIGTMEPIGRFFDVPFSNWSHSIHVNALGQLGALHTLAEFRDHRATSHVCFLAGGGTNNPFTNYSAYCVSKIFLIKMCELIDDEYKDINCFIVGPGYVATKIHGETIKNKTAAGENYQRTLEFLETSGTDIDDVYDSIAWCIEQGRAVMGGRNLSTKHDAWRNGGQELVEHLRSNKDFFKLRRANISKEIFE